MMRIIRMVIAMSSVRVVMRGLRLWLRGEWRGLRWTVVMVMGGKFVVDCAVLLLSIQTMMSVAQMVIRCSGGESSGSGSSGRGCCRLLLSGLTDVTTLMLNQCSL